MEIFISTMCWLYLATTIICLFVLSLNEEMFKTVYGPRIFWVIKLIISLGLTLWAATLVW